MHILIDRLRRRLNGEEGFTLVELLVATMVGLIVIGIATTVFIAAIRSQPGLTERDNAISQARVTMERLVRELRQGSTIFTATSGQLSFITYATSAICHAPGNSSMASPCRVTYSCSSGTCTRQEATPDGSTSGSSLPVVSGLSNSDVFSYSPSTTAPTYIGAKLVFPGQNGSDAITLSDGAALRNPTAPPS